MPKDKTLYAGGEVNLSAETDAKDLKKLKLDLETLLTPTPNSKTLGFRTKLRFHYKAQREKPGFVSKYLNRKFGESPVYFSSVDPDRTVKLLENRLENHGFFHSRISFSVKESKNLTSVDYTVKAGAPYLLNKLELDTISLPIHEEIQKSLSNTLLDSDQRFDLDIMKAERNRIDDYLKKNGYYNFNANFLIFEADTNQSKNKRYDLILRLKNDVPEKSLVPYTYKSIYVYPDYRIDSLKDTKDTIKLSNYYFLQEPEFFKPERLTNYLVVEKGEKYDPNKTSMTSSRLSSIGTYKYVNIQLSENMPTDSTSKDYSLDAHIYLSALAKRSIRTEIQAVTKSNSFAGPTLSIVYSNRNLFKGGETLNISANVGYEQQITNGSRKSGLSSTQLGIKTDLIFPRIFLPVNISKEKFQYAVPRTKVSLGFDYFRRSNFYNLKSANGSFGYSWNKNKYVFHQLNPMSVNYVNIGNISDEFDAILSQNSFLQISLQQQFIAGLTYSFTYNQLVNQQKKNPIYFNTNIDLSGNTINLLNSLSSNGENKFLGIEYAQYVKMDMDIRYYLRMRKERVFVARMFGGVGLPYGNSVTLPFSKQYFSGGAYSVRAFRARSLGPGSYQPTDADQGAFFDRAGDIRLEANLEYRFPIAGFLKGALFTDAGNVWLTNKNEALEGGKFSSDFLSELGVGIGMGLRVDIQNFVIRLDMAAPVRKPYLPKTERNKLDLKTTVLNFAIGYPF
jgi:outer membrane protein insertion porin family